MSEEKITCPECGPQGSEVEVIEFGDGYVCLCSECDWESWVTEATRDREAGRLA